MWRRRQWHPTPVLLPGKSHGRRSLVGVSPWGRTESDTTEQLHFHFSLSCTGEGNGNPLQCSCLENPRDGEAWWAAVYGVTQSRTWLKWLSSNRCERPLFETMKIIKKYLKLNPRKIFYLKYSAYFVEKFWNVCEHESSGPSCLYSHSSEPRQEMPFHSHYLCSCLSTLLQM